MGLVKEPKNVDFFVIDNPWSKEERDEFSELIKKEKSNKSFKSLSFLSKQKKHLA